MPTQLIVARKEILDSARDVRSMISSLFYALMGPIVVLLVSRATLGGSKSGSGATILLDMMTVFALVAVFVGGMNVAMDTIAGERERRSLLPLLLHPVPRWNVLMGKWFATGAFALGGMTANLIAFAIVLKTLHIAAGALIAAAFGLIPLALFAAALELLISTLCRAVKEAHTYLSLLVFLPMGLGMFLVFFPGVIGSWWFLLPVAGQQSFLGAIVRGQPVSAWETAVLAIMTVAGAMLALWAAAKMLHRDEVVYGN
jgi:sodium transport system permease protein